MATVELTDSAKADFDSLPVGIQARVAKVFIRLRAWPVVSGAKPLRHNLSGSYRIRTGDYRVVFHVTGTVVTIDRIDNRKDVYSV